MSLDVLCSDKIFLEFENATFVPIATNLVDPICISQAYDCSRQDVNRFHALSAALLTGIFRTLDPRLIRDSTKGNLCLTSSINLHGIDIFFD
jgi:hypothetical protein